MFEQKWPIAQKECIEFIGESRRVDGKSILDVLTLAAEQGTRLVIEATGPDADKALEAIGRLFDCNFNELGEDNLNPIG